MGGEGCRGFKGKNIQQYMLLEGIVWVQAERQKSFERNLVELEDMVSTLWRSESGLDIEYNYS